MVSTVFRAGTHRRWTSLRHVIRQNENPPEGVRAGSREPSPVGYCGNDGKGPSGQTGGGGQRFINHCRRQRDQPQRFPTSAFSEPMGTGLLSSPCGKLDGYGGWWFWRRRHQQHGSYLGRIRGELA